MGSLGAWWNADDKNADLDVNELNNIQRRTNTHAHMHTRTHTSFQQAKSRRRSPLPPLFHRFSRLGGIPSKKNSSLQWGHNDRDHKRRPLPPPLPPSLFKHANCQIIVSHWAPNCGARRLHRDLVSTGVPFYALVASGLMH